MISFSESHATISETLQTNSIVWIHSLLDAEMGPTRRMIEGVEGLITVGGFPVIEKKAGTKNELLAILTELAKEAKAGLRPIVHFDMHGSLDEGLLLAPSGERVSWAETIGALRRLNGATGNNLVCVFALCFGLQSYREVRLKEAAPAYFFCGPPAEITVGLLEIQTVAFYREMHLSGNVTAAFDKTLKAGMDSFHCQGLFFQALLRYIARHCSSKHRAERAEKLVSAILKRDGIANPSPAQLKGIRKQVKYMLTPGQHIVDLFAPHFLAGRPAAFGYSDLKKVLDRSAARKAS
ncbi:hypothetical protein IR196_06920 [Brucella anthropi]|uniref:hypothetical protein n=1 Tax=Brucella anthropi TaxID=529 RepID=UPI00188A6928|nr:hypothetical protein [Brucella anthropi]QPA25812.1 hypothetical protein IR196_06920 [Brucella anthropi]